MKPAFPPGVDSITHNGHDERYALIDDVSIGTINVEQLEALNIGAIVDLAREVEALLSKSDGKP